MKKVSILSLRMDKNEKNHRAATFNLIENLWWDLQRYGNEQISAKLSDLQKIGLKFLTTL